MLGFLPDPYPDEILYSVCARYAERVNYPNKLRVNRDLFGKKVLTSAVYFPTRLDNLISSLNTSQYNADQIINENTIYPFYEPFVSKDRAKIIRREMRSEQNNHIRSRLSTNIHWFVMPTHLRFCPLCVKEDRNNFGETFWHRSHQLSGVLVCSKHECFLENSSIKRERKNSTYYDSADKNIVLVSPKTTQSNNPDDQLFISIAKLADWFLQRNNLSLAEGELRRRFYEILLQKELAFYNGQTRNKKLIELLKNSFSEKSLEILGCTIKSGIHNWLSSIFNISKTDVLHHPIRYFLLMIMLDIHPSEIFIKHKKYQPFGEPPYPCLNKAADHYMKPIINDIQILDYQTKDKNKKRKPLGVFTCQCGFIYQRLGPDKSENDRFSFNLVKEYGASWESEFTKMWSDLSLSSCEIGRRIGISSTSVGRHAIRLRLPMNISNSRTLQGYNRHRNPNKSHEEKRQNYREKWLFLIKNNPTASRKQLSDLESYAQDWLRKYDLEWFESNSPKPIKQEVFNEILDWNEIDENLSTEVKRICDELYDLKSFPVRVSIAEIIKRTGKQTWLGKRQQKLPLTDAILSEKLESLEDYMIRKIDWAAEQFIKEKKLPTFHQLERRAVVRNKTSLNSERIKEHLLNVPIKIRKALFNE